MEKVREIVVLALAERAKKGIKTRQPLKSLTINNKTIVESKELTDLIKEEVNVKEVIFGKNVKLDIKITNELKIEGMIRDLIRFVQGMRKDGGLKPGQKICLHYSTSSKLNEIILKHQTEIQEEVTAKKIESKIKEKEVFLAEKEVELDGQKIWIGIRK